MNFASAPSSFAMSSAWRFPSKGRRPNTDRRYAPGFTETLPASRGWPDLSQPISATLSFGASRRNAPPRDSNSRSSPEGRGSFANLDPILHRIIGHQKEDLGRTRQRLQLPEQDVLLEPCGQRDRRVAQRDDTRFRGDLDPSAHKSFGRGRLRFPHHLRRPAAQEGQRETDEQIRRLDRHEVARARLDVLRAGDLGRDLRDHRRRANPVVSAADH